MIWNNSKLESLYYSKDEAWGSPCVVKITDDEILVEYYEDDGLCQFVGKNNGSGHFELRTSDSSGQATLHQFPNSHLLEGAWVFSGERGMWRIELA
ncbi:hypothetical protein [Rhodanobacter sp. C05]|uniref:hypothetical protein n=1 Tax=Rhodanobacter sp. C05 TaxID=1945855 RepID=UPI0009875D8D|nr:hypothetical protein [Rhodanobacter sp. C05]OOG36805.1 hypothetical protein B0E51_17735 [Rhodanobacter sp. C05]